MDVALTPHYQNKLDQELDAEVARRWRCGELAEMLLDAHQLVVYRMIRAWQRAGMPGKGARRIFVLRIARRWGKTFLVALMMIEDLIRNNGWHMTYATAFQNSLEDIVEPMIEELFETCPADMRPIYKKGKRTYWFPSSRSILKLVGVDKNPNALRGKKSNGFCFTEAGFVPKLAKTIGEKIYPQFQRHSQAYMILESSAPESPTHDFDARFAFRARARDAFFEATIDDNTAISDEEKREYVEAAREIDPIIADREYYNVQGRDSRLMVIPDFNKLEHIKPPGVMPKYAHCYVSMDPGEGDPLGAVLGFYDFDRAKLVIQKSRAKSNWSTGDAADWIKEWEYKLWGTQHRPKPGSPKRDYELQQIPMMSIADVMKTPGGLVWSAPPSSLTYWDGTELRPNPYRRISDIDARTIGDMAREESLNFEGTAKDDAYAQRNALRRAFREGWIEIWEEDGQLARELEFGKFRLNSEGYAVDWLREEGLGHLDCLAALIYLWRNLSRELNPFPPFRIETAMHDVALPLGVDHDSATGREQNRIPAKYDSDGWQPWR